MGTTGIRALYREAAEAVPTPSPAELTRLVVTRLRRRRIAAAGAGVLVVALLGGTAAAVYADRPAPEPIATVNGPAVPLPVRRAVGVADRIEGECGAHGCVPVLTTTDGRRYTVPGTWTKNGARASLSPDGHWLSYAAGSGAKVRDLTATRVYRIAGAHNSALVSTAWSTNSRWALADLGRGGGIELRYRIDLAAGRTLRVGSVPAHGIATRMGVFMQMGLDSIAPDGRLIVPNPGLAPPHDHTVTRSGAYDLYDPVTRAVAPGVPLPAAVEWFGRGRMANSDPQKSGVEIPFMGPMDVRSDGRYGLAEFPSPRNKLWIVDLATGTSRRIDPLALVKATPLAAGTVGFVLSGYTDRAITLRARDGDSILGTLVLSADGTRVLSATRLSRRYPYLTVLPGL